MSQPEAAPLYIYKNPLPGPGLVEGDTFGHGEDLAPGPGLVEGDTFGRSDDIFETIPNEGIVRSEIVDDIDITENRTPETAIEDGLFSAEAVDADNSKDTIHGLHTSRIKAFGSKIMEVAGINKEKIRKLATIGAVGVVAVGGAKEIASNYTDEAEASQGQASSNKYMKPREIKQFLFKRVASYNDKNDMRPTRLILTRDKLDMLGKCNPNNKYNPYFRVWKNLPDKSVSVSCGGRKVVGNYNPASSNAYYIPTTKYGDILARKAKVSDNQHGNATSIVATSLYTKIKYDNTGGPVDSIVYRNHGKPAIYK